MAPPRCAGCGCTKWTADGRCRDCNEFPTLGYEVWSWIEDHCVIPDGEFAGDPFLLTDEQARFLLNFYRLLPAGKFFHERGGQLIRPQKWGKGPISAAIICAEGQGPVVFDGWDAEGNPVGRPWATPWIQLTAISESQTANVWRALVPMVRLGSLSAEIPDTGETRINLPGGGRIEPVTASARSRLGQRITFALEDETHSWYESNGGRTLADNQRRNIAGMQGRWLETTNAWDPAEESVAQQTYESKEPGVYIDDVEPGEGSVRNKRERRKMLKLVYGDSAAGSKERGIRPWIDLDRIDAEIRSLLERDGAQAERFFLNRKIAGESRAFSVAKWDALAEPREVKDGSLIVLGVDGARSDDALAVIATEVESGYQWPIGIWEVPKNAPEDYEHPFNNVDAAVEEAMERWEVWRIYIDPGSTQGNINHLVDRWQGRWGDKRVIDWHMNRQRPVAYAVRNYTVAINRGDLTHDGDEVFARHIKNSVKSRLNVRDDDGRHMHTISKDRSGSPRKIDAAAAGVLSWEARGDAIADGATAGGGSEVWFGWD